MFIGDVIINIYLDSRTFVEIVVQTAKVACWFGVKLKVVMFLFLNFGIFGELCMDRIEEVVLIVREFDFDLIIDGFM